MKNAKGDFQKVKAEAQAQANAMRPMTMKELIEFKKRRKKMMNLIQDTLVEMNVNVDEFAVEKPNIDVAGIKLSLDKLDFAPSSTKDGGFASTRPTHRRTATSTNYGSFGVSSVRKMNDTTRDRIGFGSGYYQGKFDKDFQKLRQNRDETKRLRTDFSEFYQKLTAAKEIAKKDSKVIVGEMRKVQTEMEGDYKFIAHEKEKAARDMPLDFEKYKDKKKFKSKLADHIMSKVADTHAFLNVYLNKINEERMKDDFG